MNTIINTEESKPLPQLIKKSSTYKLIVPENVEEKIRYLIRKYPSTEWSGVLFYTHQGTFENNDLVITCQDIFPMDLGTSGWTEFHMSEDVAAYMADNIELFDCDMGLIHSHHSMGAFFSGQDVKMIQQEGNDTNCFVSLVVDTRGTYVAIVTRKVQQKSEITIKNVDTSYEFFGEGTKILAKSDTESTKVIDKEVIEYFSLDVERHEVPNTLDYLDSRFAEITRKKAAKVPASFQPYLNEKPLSNQPYIANNEPTLFDNATMKSLEVPTFTKEDEEKFSLVEDDWIPNKKLIHKAVINIVTCSLIVNPDKFDLKQWIKRHMDTVYTNLFDENSFMFEEWKDFIVQFTLDHYDINDIPDFMMDDINQVNSIIAFAILEELEEYSKDNKYIEEYCEALQFYI